ncbi:hypothetical protein GCM10010377_36300 [Streptomyces viridiviolaceus]|uniref:DUF4142 domain-containing protein n=1 Tax=Streptomyces viridiviolaceus TaxID=68282 RepID=A0ABW2E8Q5_9ACTN|nr:DUF4142 domain-containing protein [Streptomyces viridiviolaceus]GHB42210.1 hypothetical protein GCM10010377_36300 [Streptomyces viridiviolaceus]
MRLSRSRIGVVVLFGAMTLTLTALAFPAVLGLDKADGDPGRVIAGTKYGPLTEADRDFVVKVRAAGLWEYPLGEMAMARGTTKEMKEAGEHLVVGHAGLDAMCREIAPELGITLPNKASPQQEGFVATVDSKSGREFDSTAVNIMRVTHGQIFPAIAKIRATTKNTLVRQLADLANDTVLDHITVLEKTGLVEYDQVTFQQTGPAKLPEEKVTPPPPQPGERVLVLKPRPDLDVNTATPTPTAAPTVR